MRDTTLPARHLGVKTRCRQPRRLSCSTSAARLVRQVETTYDCVEHRKNTYGEIVIASMSDVRDGAVADNIDADDSGRCASRATGGAGGEQVAERPTSPATTLRALSNEGGRGCESRGYRELIDAGLVPVSPADCFNAALAGGGGLLVVDCRLAEGARSGSVADRWDRPLPEPVLLAPPNKHDTAERPLDVEAIEAMIYGDLDRLAFGRRAGRAVLLIDEGAVPSEWTLHVAGVLLDENRASRLMLLEGGVESFVERYPGLRLRPPPASATAFPSEILPSLYLGNARHAVSEDVVQGLGITHVVNAAPEVHECHRAFEAAGVEYCEVDERDNEDVDIGAHFERVYAFVAPHVERDSCCDGARPHRVLIHCRQGVSRSATLTVYCVMRARNMTLLDAFNLVFARREVVCPNYTFRKCLLKAELMLRGSNSVSEAKFAQLGLPAFTTMRFGNGGAGGGGRNAASGPCTIL